MFKSEWEKSSELSSLDKTIFQQIRGSVFSDSEIRSCDLLSGGCGNLNYKIIFGNGSDPKILRIYLRPGENGVKEQKISELLRGRVPVPQYDQVGVVGEYSYAILEFKPGLSLRDILLTDHNLDISHLMFQIGRMLSEISGCIFPEPGFFDENLRILSQGSSSVNLMDFAIDCLLDDHVINLFTSLEIDKVRTFILNHKNEMDNLAGSHLVHGDFDPANILVNQIDGIWTVSAILDWEFSFSGSWLWDVSNMLRYAHKMPCEFQESFLRGMCDNDRQLPHDWEKIINTLNVISLLDIARRTTIQNHPKTRQDIKELITHILEN